MDASVKVACAQVEPVILERDATIEKMASTCAEAAAEGAKLVVFPESFVSVYPSSRWARYMAEWEKSDEAKTVFARLMRESVELPSEAADRIGAVARENGVWLAVGVNERDRGTIYNALLVYAPDGTLALHHRKLMPTNHERMVWGLGTGKGLTAIPTPIGKIGGLICWENFMPLARFALYDAGVEIYLAPTADDTETWHETIRHIARESRAFVVSPSVFQRASSYPDFVPIADGPDVLGRGGSAVVGPDGNYLAGPLWDEEGILYAELDPDLLYAERQRFDPAGHYSRPDVFTFEVR